MSVACTQSSSAGSSAEYGVPAGNGRRIRQRTVDTPMNGADRLQRAFALVVAAEGERAASRRRCDATARAARHAAAERAVVGDARGNQGMRKLQEDRPHSSRGATSRSALIARRDGGWSRYQRVVSQVPSESADCDLTAGVTAADLAQVVRVCGIGEMRGGIAAQQREAMFLLQVVPVVLERARLLEVPFFREKLDDLAVDA